MEVAWSVQEVILSPKNDMVLERSARTADLFDGRDETPEIEPMGIPEVDAFGVGIPPLQDGLDLPSLYDFTDAMQCLPQALHAHRLNHPGESSTSTQSRITATGR